MTRKKTTIVLLFVLIFIIAIVRIGRTIFPALKPTINKVDIAFIEETIPLDAFVAANGVDTFLKSSESIEVSIFAKDLKSPRTIIFDNDGRMLVGTNKGKNIIRLSDTNQTGFASEREEILTNLDRPHGLLLHEGFLYVAEEEKLVRYRYKGEDIGTSEIILTLPKGGRHFTRSLATTNNKLYISIGSSCDNCLEKNEMYASVIELNFDGSEAKIFATGLRNAVFIKTNPITGELFGTDMGRDHLGDDLPPDEVNIIKEGRGYGWPFCYGKQVYDEVFAGIDNCSFSEPSLLDLPAHVSPLGFAFIPNSWGIEYAGDLLVALHGSWNRSIPVGYSIVRFNKTENGYSEVENVFLEGFLREDDSSFGRPVDLVFDSEGTLYMSDDKVGIIYAIRQL